MRRLILILIILFCGCSAHSNKLPHNKPKLNLTLPDELKLDSVKFIVVHKDNVEEVFRLMESKEETPVLIGLTGDDYKNLSVNIQKIENVLREYRKTVILYKEYYEK